MSELNSKYKQIMEDIENNIKDPETLEFVKNKIGEVSVIFVDMLDRITRLTDNKIQEIEEKQHELLTRVNSVQSAVDGIESDIYDDENYEFEIVCPYCNYEFTADIEDESKEEIQCPECHNTIELDWNLEEEMGCSGSCSHCASNCVAEDEAVYELKDTKKPKKQESEEIDDEEDM